MRVVTLCRYPVKSMLGEKLDELRIDAHGVEGDRTLALVDAETGRVATAKHPRLWRALLTFAATGDPGRVHIRLPGGDTVAADRPDLDELLSELLGRPVRMTSERPSGATVERPDPEDVLAHGVEAEVEAPTLEIAQGTEGGTFVDYAPLHLISTATLEHIGAEAARYRPNVVVDNAGQPAWLENEWVGREIRIGSARARAVLPTPRCSVPTLEHGELPRAPHAVRVPMAENRVEVEGFGVLPCAGVYLEVLDGGTIRLGDPVTVG